MSSSSSSSIPLMRSPANVMQEGPNSSNLQAQAQDHHPVDQLQRSAMAQQHGDDLEDVRRIYGSGLAMRLATERKAAACGSGRLPGMSTANSNILQETLLGTDTKLDFGDYLSLPSNTPVGNNVQPHAVMEQKLGL